MIEKRPDFDLLAGRFYADRVHDAFTWMRAHEPVYYDAGNDVHAVTRHADIMEVSKTTDVYCSGQGVHPDSEPMPMMISER